MDGDYVESWECHDTSLNDKVINFKGKFKGRGA